MSPVNRFDQPAQAEFINTYSPLPFQELYAATQQRRGVLDENMARLDAARAKAAQLKYIPGSEDERYIKGVTQTMDTIADEFIDKDLSDPEIYRKLRSDLRSKINQGDINDVQSSYAAWAGNQKTVAQLKKEGKYHQALDLDPALGYSTLGSQGVYGHQTEGLLDARSAAEKFFNQIEASSNIDIESGMVRSGVGKTAIENAIKQNVGNFINTREGEQTVRLAASAAGVDYNALNQEEKEGLATQYLRDVGEEFKFNRETPLPAGYMRGQGAGDANYWKTETDQTPSVQVGNLEGLKSSEEAGTTISLHQGATSAGTSVVSFSGEQSEESREKAKSAWAQKATNEKLRYGLGDMSTKDFIPLYNKAINGLNNQSLGVHYVTDEDVTTQIKSQMISGINNRNFMLHDGHGTSESGKLENNKGILKELGMNLEEFKEALNSQPALMFTQDGPEAGMYGISVKDKQGRSRNLFTGSGSKVQGMTGLSNQINTRMRNLDDSPITTSVDPKTNRSVGIRVVPRLDPTSEQFVFSYEIGYTDKPTFEKIRDYNGDINSIKATEMNALVNSGIIGSNLNWNNLSPLREQSPTPFF